MGVLKKKKDEQGDTPVAEITTPQNNEERQKIIDAALTMIDKRFGEGSLMRLGSRKKLNVETISTGALSLDAALGVGGVPRGRVMEIYGPEASGKTTLALSIVAEAQRAGGKAAFIDAEHALDPSYAKRIGVDVNDLYVSQPDFGEQALDILETLIRSGAFDVIVVDSVAALVPKAEVDGEMGDVHMGLQARLMSQALRKITPLTAKSNTVVIFLNQIRLNLGVKFGNPETTTGGNALKFYCSLRLDIRRREEITKNGELLGHTREVKVVKNKVAPPFRNAHFDIRFASGIDKVSSIFEAGVKYGIIEQAGAWYSLNGEKIGQGKESVIEFLRDKPELQEKIRKDVLDKLQ
ncbi:MAG: recombinase RecA [Candidatus Dojkabacteria bacterium]|nr:MAG: recombinase RecA [Candidatus Dojkabacteria bacterium]